METRGTTGASKAQLKQSLRGYQIFFIVISGIIGAGVFNNNGQALAAAGPVGMLTAVVVLGVIAICVGETVSEFAQVFPAPNGIFEYVYAFVDEELAWVVTISYWYSFASLFALHMLEAASLLRYWYQEDKWWSLLLFYGFCPFILFFINLSGVWWFGLIETIGGAFKMAYLIGITLTLYIVSGKEKLHPYQPAELEPSNPFSLGFTFRGPIARTPGSAFCLVLPLVAYGYVGIEGSILAAFEARPPNGIGWPSRTIHWATFVLYLLCTIGIIVTVDWGDPLLPYPYGAVIKDYTSPTLDSLPDTENAVVIAMWRYGHGSGVFNALLIFGVISAANTSLYIASRTLYGLTYRIRGRNILSKQLKKASIMWEFTGVPAMAIFWSVMSFYWLPWLSKIEQRDAVRKLNTIISITSSVSCLVVWAAICVAFHRYEKWTRLCADRLEAEGYSRFLRDSTEYQKRVQTLFFWLQPWNARVGFVGCLILFAFSSATWWYDPVTVWKVATAYGLQIVLFAVWFILKSYNRWKKGWVRMEVERNPRTLIRRLKRLELVSQIAEHRNEYYRNTLNGEYSIQNIPDDARERGREESESGLTNRDSEMATQRPISEAL
ncbi:hypothetical protein AAE478_001480 [Parahypoxylon ruwenzoriense]